MARTRKWIDERFGRLVVVELLNDHERRVLCRCDCGKTVVVWRCNLSSGNTSSCGCLHSEITRKRLTRHGQTKSNGQSAEYRCWSLIKTRCHNPATPLYRYYGALGVSVCDQWRYSFEAFFADMGPKPTPKHSIDRIDPFGNYEPGNCRWATHTEQMNNLRRHHRAARGDT